MAIDYKLKSTVGETYPTDLDDVWVLKKTLRRNGLYAEPSYGMTPYPDADLFNSIKQFQKQEGLRVDGVMKPGGETERRMEGLLATTALHRCVHCGNWHGGVYSPRVCHQCWDKGLR